MNKDNKYKALFEKPTPDYDHELIWANIEPHLPKKQKRRPVMFWLLIGFISFAAIYIFNASYAIIAKKETQNQSLPLINIGKPIVYNNESAVRDIKSKSIINETNQPKSQIETKMKSSSSIGKSNNTNQREASKANISNKAFLRKVNLEKQNIKNINKLNSTVLVQHIDHLETKGNNLNPSDNQEKQVDLLHTELTQSIDHAIVERARVIIEKLSSNNHSQIEVNFVNHSFDALGRTPNPLSKNLKSSFFMETNAFVGHTTQSLSALKSESDEYVKFKKYHERVVENFGFNILLGYKKQNFTIATGLQYDRITEILTADDLTITKYNIISDSALYLENSNSITYLSGKREVTRTIGKSIISPNTINRWSIPVRLGYDVGLNAKMKLNLNIGINFNFVNQYEGIAVDQGLNFIYKDRQKLDQVYKTGGVHAWMGGASVHYLISKRFSLGSGIQIQSDLTSQIRNEWNTSQKYNFYRMNVSANYLIF